MKTTDAADEFERIAFKAMVGAGEYARMQWREYYRAVRIIRKIRRVEPMTFLRFSRAWWAGSYKDEPVSAVGLFASMGHTVRPRQRRILP